MADISTIKMNDRKIEILHPGTGEPIGVRCTVCAVDDERLEKIRHSITNARLEMERKAKKFTADMIEENSLRLAEAAIIEWEWYDTGNGEGPASFEGDTDPECNPRNKRRVFAALPWFAEQIADEIRDSKDFFSMSK